MIDKYKLFKPVKKFSRAKLLTCLDKKHKKGCYIQLTDEKAENSIRQNVLLYFNKKGEIIGIDLFAG